MNDADKLAYPKLSDAAEEDAQKIIDWFKKELIKSATEALGKMYTDVATHIQSDSWTNYRNSIMEALCNYESNHPHKEHNFKRIRQAILREHRAELIADLDQDLVKEVEELKKQLIRERDFLR